jgi:hypothetical protein
MDYKKQFQDALLAAQAQDPAQKELKAQIMRPSQGASIAPTLGLVDHLTGSNFASQAPKEESMKDKLGQLLQLRQGAQGQKLSGLGQLAKMQSESENMAADRAFKERMFGLQSLNAKAKLQKAMGPAKLGSEDKKALGYTQSLQRDLQAYREAVKNGGIRPEMWSKAFGDTPTTALRKALVENYGRLQSGGAISGDEESRFGSLFGGMMDSPEIIEQKLARIENEINAKSALYGGTQQATRMPSNNSLTDYDSMSDEELMALISTKAAQ